MIKRINDPGFNFNAWAVGIEFDMTGDKWGNLGKIRTRKPNKVKAIRSIKPAIGVLTQPGESGGRSVQEHRDTVDRYGAMYDQGIDPITGQPITDQDELRKGCSKVRNDEPWRANRGAATTDADGLALLMQVFKGQHDASPDGDDD